MPKHHLPEQHLPAHANAGLLLQPARRESRNARSFARRLYCFLNASALTAVSSRRILTVAILVMAAWLATPTTAQAQGACSVGDTFSTPRDGCTYYDNQGAFRFFADVGGGIGCTFRSVINFDLAVPPGHTAGCDVNNLALSKYNGFSASYTASDTTWTVKNVPPQPPTFLGTVGNQRYDLDQIIDPLSLPAATGGTGTRTYMLTGLPTDSDSGLEFNDTTLLLSGTPISIPNVSYPITYNMTYTVTDSSNRSPIPLRFSITINPAPLTFSGQTEVNKEYTVGQAITTITLPAATGGTGTRTYMLTITGSQTITSIGLSFDATTRGLSGTPNANAVTPLNQPYAVTYTATDAYPNLAPVTISFTITIDPAPPAFLPSFPVDPPADPTYTQGMRITPIPLPEATGGTTPRTYDLEGLPDSSGLAFNDTTRVLSGTPNQNDTEASPIRVTYTVTDANSNSNTAPFRFLITVNPHPLTFSEDPVAQTYTQGTPITRLPLSEATGNTGTLSYSLTGLPDGSGLTFDDTTRVLSGTPNQDDTEASPIRVTYTATDSENVSNPLDHPFTITVNDALSFSETVPDQIYNEKQDIAELTLPEAAGGTGNRSYTLVGSPSITGTGLEFDGDRRILSGTPQILSGTPPPNSYSMVYRVRDTNGATTTPLTFTITIRVAPNFTDTVEPQTYTQDRPIPALTLPTANGGTGSLRYSLTIKDQEALPVGLEFDQNADSLVLSGTPTIADSYSMVYTATDSGDVTDTLEFTITVNSAPTFSATVDPQAYTVTRPITDLTPLPEATGGTGPFRYTLTIQGQSALPAGLAFAPATRVLSGTPTIPGNYNMAYTFTDRHDATATQNFAITVNGAPTFSEPAANQGFPRGVFHSSSALPLATGGTPDVNGLTYAITTTLPAGLNFNANNRVIAGNAGQDNYYKQTYTATDKHGAVATLTFTLRVALAPVTLVAPTFSSEVAPQGYIVGRDIPSFALPEATGGTGDSGDFRYTLAIQGEPQLPGGLAFNDAVDTRSLSGRPTTARSYNMIYTVTDTNNVPASLFFTITVAEPPAPPVFPEGDLPPRTYTQGTTITDLTPFTEATGGAPPLTYTLLPFASGTGFNFNGATRVLSGTPNLNDRTPNPSFDVTYTVTDGIGSDSRSFTITVNPSLTPTFDGQTFADQSYTVDQTLPANLLLPEATGGTGTRTYTLNIKDQSGLPAGLIFDGTTRILSGTPTAVTPDGTPHQMSYTVSDSSGSAAATPLEFTITIAPEVTLTGVTFADQSYTVDQPLPANLLLPEATGGTGTRTYTLNIKDQSGLPAGLIFDGTTRILSGTPTAVTPDGAPHQMSYTVSDSSGSSAATPLEFTITIAPEVTLTGVTFADQSYTVDQPLPANLLLPEATGGTGTRTYTLNIKDQSGLPAGLIFDGTTRILSGTPTAVTPDGAPHQMSYTVSDSSGSAAATPLEFTITIAPEVTLTGVTFADQSYTVDQPLPANLLLPEATGGTGTRTYTLNIKDQSGLPAGLIFDGTTRILSGTPTAVTADGAPHQMSYTVSDSSGSSAATPLEFTITIAPEVTLTGVTFADQSYTVDQTLPANLLLPEATGGTGTRTYTLNIKDQSGLPAGLIFDGTTRILSGTPTAVTPDGAPHQMSYTVSDSSGSAAATPLEFTITIAAAPTPLTFTGVTFADQSYTVDQTLPANLLLPEATGGTGTRTYTLNIKDQSGLPAGLIFDGTTRILSGTPTAVTPDGAPHQMSYTVSDSSGSAAATPLEFTITIAAAPTPLTFTGVTFADQSYTVDQTLPANLLLPEATGGTTPRTYTLNIKDQSGLPAGLIFDGTTRILSGTPTAVTPDGTPHQMSYTVSDSSGSAAATPLEFTITIAAAPTPLTFTGVTFADQSYTVDQTLPANLLLPEATGGTGTRTYTLNIKDQSGLPAGLIFDGTTRILSGTPTAVTADGAPHQMSYTVSDSSGSAAATPLEFTITIAAAPTPLTFTGVTFADQSYTVDQTLPANLLLPEATGGTGTRTYTLNIKDQSGLPAGLIFDGTTRILSGTPTAVTPDGAPHQMSYTVSDSSGSSAATPLEFTITIAAAPTPLTFTGVTFADQSYTVDQTLPANLLLPEATGGTGTRTYTLNIKDQSGLPAGLIFDGTTRILSGTPTAVTPDGAPHQMSYTVSDSSGSSAATPLEFTITIAAAPTPLTFTGVTFADQSYTVDQTLPANLLLPEATGGTGTRTYTLNIKDQSGLPAGLIFDGTTRILSGTPTAVTPDGAPHQMSYTVSDSSGSAAATPLEFTITIAAAPTPLTFTGVTFADQSYTVDQTLPANLLLPEATGGTGTRTYTLNIKDQSGLPAGLIFDGTTRILSGTPTAVTPDGAPHQMSYTVSDSSGSAAATPLEFTITIAAAPTPLTFTGVTFADQSYTVDQTLPANLLLPEATGGTGTRTYTLNIKDQSGLPAGLIFDGTTRILSGTPTAVTADGAPHQMSYTVSDSSGSAAATPLEFTITIAAAPTPLTFTGVTFADQSYTVDQTLPANLLLPEATGGTGTRTYTLNIKDQSGLPAGLIFDGTTRILSGTPTAVTPDGAPHQMSYTVSDSSGSAAATPLEFTITIAPEVTLTGVTFADQSYTVDQTLPANLLLPEATGGTGTRTYTLNIKDQSGLPAGLIFDGTTRILSGTPTAVTPDGTPHQMSYTVSDSSGSSAATPLEFTITIAAAPTPLTFTGVTFADQSYTVDQTLPANLLLPEATGGTGTRTYTLNIKDQSGLPAGLIFDGTTRILSGTPTAVTPDGAPHQMSYTVSDSSGSAAATPLEFTITIAAAPTPLTFTGVTFADQSYTVDQTLPANLLLPEATGGTGTRTYTLNIKDQSGLPAGLIFDGTTRILSGTPTAVTTDGAPHQMSYTVSDSSGSAAATPLEFTITIAAAPTPLTFTGVTFADQSYTVDQTLPANLLLPEATGGTGTRTYTLNIKDQSGLPAGLIFDGTTRILSGTPTAVTPDGAPHQMSYTVSDSSGSAAATPLEFTITITPAAPTPLTFTGVTFADQSYTVDQTLPANLLLPEATGGTGTRTYTLNIKDQSGLPAGLIFDGTTRILSGTPTAVTPDGTPHQMSYTVSDSSGSAAATPLEFTITIAAAPTPLTFTGVTFADQSYTVLLPLPDDLTLPEATGGTGTRTYTLNIKDQSGLPAGLIFNGTTRILSGTPTAVTPDGAPHQMSYTVSDSSGSAAATPLEFTITIAAAPTPLTFTGVTFADQSYTVDQTLPANLLLPEATGGTGTRTYTLNIKDQSGLPTGLIFNGTTRILSGTPTAVTPDGAPHQMSYTVSDSSGSSAATPLEFTITIAAAPTPLTFTGVTFADQSYTVDQTLPANLLLPEATGGTGTRTYTLNIKDQSGLPAGLIFDGTTRLLSGTPTAVTPDGTPHQMSYTVSDSSGSAAATPLEFTITIAAAPTPLTFTGVTFADQSYTVDQPLPANLLLPEATGGTTPRTYTLNIKDQSGLPAGLIFDGTTRLLSGTPTAVTPDGTPHQMSYTVSDSSGSSAATPLEFTITIAAAPTPLTFTGVTFADQSYTVDQTLPANLLLPEATGGTGTRTYTLNIKDQSGLPAGLIFNGTTRILSGTPTAVTPDGSPHQMSYTVSDSSGSSAATPLEFTITIAAAAPSALTFTGVTFADQSYTVDQTLPANLFLPEATGGTGTRTYTLNIKDQSGLPAGLIFNGTTRILSGTPTAVTPDGSPHQMSYTVSDSSGSSAATPLEFTITIAAAAPSALTFTGVTFADQSYTVDQTLPANLFLPEATGGTGTRTYTLNIKDQSGLPTGLIFDGTTRILSGTPTAVTPDGSPHQMTYTVSDSNGSAAATPLEFTITIAAAAPSALTFTGVTFADQSYTVLLPLPANLFLPEATGGTGTRTYTLNIKDQSGLPAGLTFNGTTRILSGTPTAVTPDGAPHQMSYTVSDSSGSAAATPLEFTITIAAAAPSALTFTGVTFADQSYTVLLPLPDDLTLPEATGGTGTRTYTLNIKDQSGLPAGLTFNGTTRILSGTPTAVTTAGSPHQMTYTVSDSSGSSAATPLEFTITIAAAAPSALTFTGVTFADQSYTVLLPLPDDLTLPEATGGTGTRTYTLNIKDQSGLPAGLTFNGTTRILSGTPTAVTTAGSPHQMTYTVSDSSGSSAATPLEFTITIAVAAAPSALTFTGVTFADQSYTQGTTITAVTLPEANGGTAPRTYTLNIKDQSGLPAGLTFNGTTRILSGTPTAVTTAGSPHQMTYTVSDSSGSAAATPLEFTITIAAATPTPSTLSEARLERVNRTTLSQVTQVMAANTAASVTARIESLASGDGRASVSFAGQSSLHQALRSSEKLPNSGTLALEKLLDGSSFTLPLAAIGANGSADSAADSGATAVWGSGDYLKFSGGKNKAVSWDGNLLSAHLGVDRRFRSNILAGLAASWYKGRLDYSDSTNTDVVSGKHENQMVILHPYVGWISSGGVSLWATVGYGWGDIDILEPSKAKRSSDSTLQTAAIGMGGNLLSSEDLIAGGTTTLRLKGDASYAKIKVKDNDAIRGLSVAVRRLRLSLEGSHEQRFDSGARLEPSVVVGLRHDSGDSETGTGVELGGGLRYIAPAAGLTLAGRGHVLVNGPGDYKEWGANLQFLLDPGVAHQGLSLNLRSLYGETPSERLWDRDLSQVSLSANNKVLGHLDMEVGYGLAAPVGPALWTPYSGLRLSSDGARRYRLGGRFELGPLFELRLEGDRQEGTDSAQHGILLQGQLRF